MTELSKFGKKRYRNRYANTGAVNAGKSWVVPITVAEIANYAPFNHLILFNRDANCALAIRLDSVVLGDDTVQASNREFFVLKKSALEIEVKDNILFEDVVITNEDGAANIAIGDLVLMFANF